MRSAAPAPKVAEAARANQGGLECSSYTWQVRRCFHAFCVFESQEESSLLGARRREIAGHDKKNSFLQILKPAFRAR